MCSFKLNVHQNCLRPGLWGELTTLPQTPYSAQDGDNLPVTFTIEAFGVSIFDDLRFTESKKETNLLTSDTFFSS